MAAEKELKPIDRKAFLTIDEMSIEKEDENSYLRKFIISSHDLPSGIVFWMPVKDGFTIESLISIKTHGREKVRKFIYPNEHSFFISIIERLILRFNSSDIQIVFTNLSSKENHLDITNWRKLSVPKSIEIRDGQMTFFVKKPEDSLLFQKALKYEMVK